MKDIMAAYQPDSGASAYDPEDPIGRPAVLEVDVSRGTDGTRRTITLPVVILAARTVFGRSEYQVRLSTPGAEVLWVNATRVQFPLPWP